MRKLFILFLFYSYLFSSKTITFNMLLEESLKNNHELLEIENKQEGLYEDIRFARIGYVPKLDFNYGIYNAHKGEEESSNNYELDKKLFSVNLSSNILDISAIGKKIDVIQSSIKITNLQKCHVKTKSAMDLLELYTQMYKLKLSLKINKKLLAYQKMLLDEKKKLYDKGLESKVNVFLEKNKLNKYNKQILDEEEKLAIYTNFLAQETGMKIKTTDPFAPIYNIQSQLDENMITDSVEDKIIDEKIRKVKEELEYIKRTNLPSLSIYFNNDFYKNDYKSEYEDSEGRDYRIGLNVKWSLNNLFNYDHEKRKKILEKKRYKIEKKKLEKKLKRDFLRHKVKVNNHSMYENLKTKSLEEQLKMIEMNSLLYENGFNSKHTVIESKMKFLNEKLALELKEIETISAKKHLSLLLEKEDICTHL